MPARGSLTAALHVLSRLRIHYDLKIDSHMADGGAQIAGLSSAAIQRHLAEFGETRRLSSEGGRSNRGARGDVAKLLDALRRMELDRSPIAERENTLRLMQERLVRAHISRHFDTERVKAPFDPAAPVDRFVEAILENARQSKKAGPVAEHLVGAKLSLRFPGKSIRCKSFASSDTQAGYSGDFEVGNTVFHITNAPMSLLYEKMKANLDRGLRVYLLVPQSLVVGVEQNTSSELNGKVSVRAIESFIATNVDELAEFDGVKLSKNIKRLLETYNMRVDESETDKSLLIELPPNL
jgi:hypothetical protein